MTGVLFSVYRDFFGAAALSNFTVRNNEGKLGVVFPSLRSSRCRDDEAGRPGKSLRRGVRGRASCCSWNVDTFRFWVRKVALSVGDIGDVRSQVNHGMVKGFVVGECSQVRVLAA